MVTAPAALVGAPLAGMLVAASATRDLGLVAATVVVSAVVMAGIKWLRRSVIRDLDDHIDDRIRRALDDQ